MTEYEQEDLSQLMARAGISNMTTLRDLQAGMLQALDEIKERDDVILELKVKLEEREKIIESLSNELSRLRTVLDDPLSEPPTSDSTNNKKRIAVSASPVNVLQTSDSASYAKFPQYV